MSEEQNIPEEKIPAVNENNSQQEAIQPTTHKTENMEVQKHPHHVTHKKKWGEYLLEFLMLFLAVFLGFVAENMREHAVEKEREKQYIKSFYEDLASDEKRLPDLIHRMRWQINAADSLQLLLSHASTKIPANLTYFYLRGLVRQLDISLFVTHRTIVQLRNSGGMRLIQNKQVSDSIVDYYKAVDRIQWLYEYLLWNKRSLREAYAPILNGNDYGNVIDSADNIINPGGTLFLRSTDASAINNCLLSISDIKGLSTSIIRGIIILNNRAGDIKKFIAHEYEFPVSASSLPQTGKEQSDTLKLLP